MDQTDHVLDLDPLRTFAEAALARHEAAQRQQADHQAAADRDQTAHAEAADHTRRSPRHSHWPPRSSAPTAPSWPRA
jgi:hypothetical protein